MKKYLMLAACLTLIASLAVGGSIAYLQDTDSAVNVMTLGNVKIVQHEKERVDMTAQSKDTPVELRNFTQDQPLYPAVLDMDGKNANDPQCWAPAGSPGALEDHYVNYGDFVTADVAAGASAWNGIWGNSLKNVRDKFVFVENTGKSDAYYRTIILMEYDETETENSFGQSMVHYNWNSNSLFDWVRLDENGNNIIVEVDGEKYVLLVATYKNPLKPNTVSRPSLLQVGLDAEATNEIVEQFGDTYDILVLSQAVQTEGFSSAAVALDTAFGEVNAENVAKWFGEVLDEHAYDENIDPSMTVLTIENFDEFKQFDAAVDTNGEYKGVKVANNTKVYIDLKTDIDLSNYPEFTGIGNGNNNAFDGVFNGRGHTIKNWTVNANWNYYMAFFRTTANLDVKNLVFENFNLGATTSKGTNFGVVIGAIGGTDVLVENVTVKDSVIKTQRTAGAIVGGMTNGRLTIKNCKVENVELHNYKNDIDSNCIAGVYLGNGWSHHDAEADGVFLENNSASNVVWYAGEVKQDNVPEYTYVK